MMLNIFEKNDEPHHGFGIPGFNTLDQHQQYLNPIFKISAEEQP